MTRHSVWGTNLSHREYFDLLGIYDVRGRLFASAERSPQRAVVVISDAVARRFWPEGNALGPDDAVRRRLRPNGTEEGAPQVPAQPYTVIGVVRDVHSTLKDVVFTYSGIYLPATPEQAATSLVLRVHGDPDTARRALLDALTRVDPALGEITTMRMVAGLEGAVLEVIFWMAIVLSGLALALTVSGLFSVLSYLVEQRRPEIGVRMALGATPRDCDAPGVAVDPAHRDRCPRRRRARGGRRPC